MAPLPGTYMHCHLSLAPTANQVCECVVITIMIHPEAFDHMHVQYACSCTCRRPLEDLSVATGVHLRHLDRGLLILLQAAVGDARGVAAGGGRGTRARRAGRDAAAAGGVPVPRAKGVAIVGVLREGVAAGADEQLGALRDVERHDRVVQVRRCMHRTTCMSRTRALVPRCGALVRLQGRQHAHR